MWMAVVVGGLQSGLEARRQKRLIGVGDLPELREGDRFAGSRRPGLLAITTPSSIWSEALSDLSRCAASVSTLSRNRLAAPCTAPTS